MRGRGWFLIFIFIVVVAAEVGFGNVSKAKIIDVDNNFIDFVLGVDCRGNKNFYRSIGSALKNANNGDIIEICPGVYYEDDLEINKNVKIVGLGQNPEDVKVVGEYNNVFYTDGWRNGVELRNIEIEQYKGGKKALQIGEGTNYVFDNLKIVSRGYGIYFSGNVQNTTVEDSEITGFSKVEDSEITGSSKKDCIYIGYASGAMNFYNLILNQCKKGIYFNNSSVGDFVFSNITFNNMQEYGVDASRVSIAKNVYVRNCYLNGNNKTQKAFYFKQISGKIDFVNNKVFNVTEYGLRVDRVSNPGIIEGNIFSNCGKKGLYLLDKKLWRGYKVSNNCFYGNNNATYAFNEDENADFNGNYWQYLNDGSKFEIPDIPVYDNHPLSKCNVSLIPQPVLSYRMDECSWDSDPNTYEIKNYGSLGSEYNATAVNGANTVEGGVLCRAGDFVSSNTSDKAIKLKNPYLLPRNYTLNMWVKFPLNLNGHINFGSRKFPVYYFNLGDRVGYYDYIYFEYNKYRPNPWTLNVMGNYGNVYYYIFNPQNLNGWHMLTFVITNKGTEFYLDGKEKYNFYTHPNAGYLGLIGNSDYGSNQESQPNGQSIGSDIDEFEIYADVLDSSQIQQIYDNEKNGKNWDGTQRVCPVCGAKIDHYEIWHYPTNLTCQPAPVEIKACANDNCSELYTGSVTLNLNYDGESKQVTFSGGEDNTTITYTQPDNITLSTSDESPTPIKPTVCHIFNSSSTSCVISFKDTGFVFKTPSNNSYVVNDGLSCESYPVEIDAVEKSDVTNKCTKMSVFNGKVRLNLYAKYYTPSNNPYKTQVIIDNSTPIQTVDSGVAVSGTPITLNFNSGTAFFNISYPDAGSIVLGAVYDNTSTGLHVSGESNPFVIKPAKFIFDNLSNPADNSSCSTDECWSEISVFKKAGEYFSFNLEAVCDNGTVTPNYYPLDQNGDNSTVNLSALMVAPDNGTDASSFLGKRVVSADEFSKGTAEEKEYFNNVGVINFKALQLDYLGAGSIEGVKRVGRFVPDHFSITSKSPGVLENGCGGFTYIGQPTTYLVRPQFVITVQSKDNQTATYYAGYFFKLSSSGVKIIPPATDDRQVGADGVNKVKIEIARAEPSLKDNNNGTAVYIFGSDNVTYVRDNNSKVSPFSPQFSFIIDNITDSDGVSCLNCPDNITVSGDTMKYGRLKIFSNYGPPDEPLTLTVQTQYYDGDGWILSSDDECTALNSGDFVVDNLTGNLSASDVAIEDVNGINNGVGSIEFKPCGIGKYGSFTVDLSNSAPFYDWLYDNNTKGTGYFGIYRGRDRVIEWREIAP